MRRERSWDRPWESNGSHHGSEQTRRVRLVDVQQAGRNSYLPAICYLLSGWLEGARRRAVRRRRKKGRCLEPAKIGIYLGN